MKNEARIEMKLSANNKGGCDKVISSQNLANSMSTLLHATGLTMLELADKDGKFPFTEEQFLNLTKGIYKHYKEVYNDYSN